MFFVHVVMDPGARSHREVSPLKSHQVDTVHGRKRTLDSSSVWNLLDEGREQ